MNEMDERERTGAEEESGRAAVGMSRRVFCLGIGGAAVALGLGGLRYAPSTPLVRPPGGQNEELLASTCIRCQKCYEICPRSVIRPAHIEDGILGTRMPEMIFDNGYCDFCEEEDGGYPLCVKVCPTGALALSKDATPKATVIGNAEINTDWCLAYHLIGCRFCCDACPYEAIELGDSNRPRVIADKCNGCGACESVCVSLKEGSIAPGATTRAIVVRTVED